MFLWIPTLVLYTSAFFALGLASLKGYDLAYRPTDADIPRALLTNELGQRIEKVASTQFTACMFANLETHESLRVIDLFSFSSREVGESNEIGLEIVHEKEVTNLYIHGKRTAFRAGAIPSFHHWTHICVSWESKTGRAVLYIDGEQNEATVQQGHILGGDGYLVLGQDQDYYNGGFDAEDGVHGRLTQFHLWDKILSKNEVLSVQNCTLKGNTVNWDNSTWRLYGGIVKEVSNSPCSSENERNECSSSELEELKNLVLNNTYTLQKEITTLKQQNYETGMEVTTLKEKIYALEKEIKIAQTNSVPIGFIYIQLPTQQEPGFLWSNVKWEDISASYAGLFFRVIGGNSTSFDQVQEETSPRLDQVSVSSDHGTDDPLSLQSDGSWTNFISTGASYVSTGAFRGIRFRLSRGEVRPRNRAVRVWRRVE